MNEIAGARMRDQFPSRTPAHFATAEKHVRDGVLWTMVMNSSFRFRFDLEQAIQIAETMPSVGVTAGRR